MISNLPGHFGTLFVFMATVGAHIPIFLLCFHSNIIHPDHDLNIL